MNSGEEIVIKILNQYQETGYVVLRKVFSTDEIDQFRAEAERLRNDKRLMDEHNLRASTRSTDSEGQIVDRLDPIIDLSEVFDALARDERIHEPLNDIFGEPALLMKDKLIFKTPGAHGYACHQDYTGWVELPAPPEAMISVLVALDASSSQNGAIEMYPGMHHKYYLEKCTPTGVLSPESGIVPEELLVGRSSDMIALEPGDIVIFSSLTPHCSQANDTKNFRRHIYFTYSASSFGDLYEQYYANYRRYLSADRASEKITNQYFA